ncbi:hypothetical protein HZS_1483 [Henneguya salminicola]|nr:hypothetical protein HZS_1483 [Henneguya salminicola]
MVYDNGTDLHVRFALLKSIRYEFQDSKPHGCYFHLKQSLYINKIIVDKIELLTLIPHCNIVKGIRYIETLITVDVNQDRF